MTTYQLWRSIPERGEAVVTDRGFTRFAGGRDGLVLALVSLGYDVRTLGSASFVTRSIGAVTIEVDGVELQSTVRVLEDRGSAAGHDFLQPVLIGVSVSLILRWLFR